MNVEFLSPVHASQLFESFNGYSWAASHKLQKCRSQLHIELFQNLKEPHDDLIMFEVVHKVGISLQIFNVDGRPSTDKNFKLLFIENSDESVRNQIMESFKKCFKLFLDAGCHFSVWAQLHIFVFILLSDKLVLSSRQQLFGGDLSKIVKAMREVQLQIILNGTILHDPLERIEVLVVLFLHVQIGDW